jgi:hypothetical protein
MRAYLGLDSRKIPHPQQEMHKENKSTSNGCKFAWEEGAETKVMRLGMLLLL